MTECYKCDKCGRLFDDWDECRHHEVKHWDPEVDVWHHARGTENLSDKAVYTPGEEAPKIIHIRMTRWNYEKNVFEYRYGEYRLMTTYSAKEGE